MNIRFIKTPEKRKIIEKLNEQYGIEDLPYLLIESGKEKIRAYTGHLSKDEISKITEIAKVELIGMYLIREENDQYRLSMDATLVLSDQINKNMIELDENQFQLWIRGYDLDIKKPKGIYVIRYKNDFIGCGKSNEERVFNFVPKDRRLKKPLSNTI